MPFFNRCLILSIASFSFQLTNADLVILNQNQATDKIEQLTRTMAEGSYGDSYSMSQEAKAAAEEAVKAAEEAEKAADEAVKAAENVPILISPKEYKTLGIKNSYKTFVDSDIWYLPESKEYAEQKYFPNKIKFFKLLASDVALFADMDDESATDDDYWTVSCSRDHITDEKICLMSKYEIVFIRSSKTGWMFSVSKETKKLNPMQYQYIRIDKSPALKSRNFFKGQPTLNIIEQMKKGNTAYTRFYEWSEDYEETIPLRGFSTAYNTLNTMYSKL